MLYLLLSPRVQGPKPHPSYWGPPRYTSGCQPEADSMAKPVPRGRPDLPKCDTPSASSAFCAAHAVLPAEWAALRGSPSIPVAAL
jgi:hypothetical protein